MIVIEFYPLAADPIIPRCDRTQQVHDGVQRPLWIPPGPLLHLRDAELFQASLEVAEDDLESVLHADEAVDAGVPSVSRHVAEMSTALAVKPRCGVVEDVAKNDGVLGVHGTHEGLCCGLSVDV